MTPYKLPTESPACSLCDSLTRGPRVHGVDRNAWSVKAQVLGDTARQAPGTASREPPSTQSGQPDAGQTLAAWALGSRQDFFFYLSMFCMLRVLSGRTLCGGADTTRVSSLTTE